MRAIWKGSISFGLVNIPVALFPATKAGKEVRFHLVRDPDLSPIRYKRVAEADGSEVPWEKIAKAYEYEKGQLVVMKEEDFKRVNISSNQTVNILEFVKLEEIDPMFFDKPYFLVPEKGGDKAYSLLRDALRKSGKVGIAKVVLKTREHLAAVKPLGDALVLELMHFSEELADPHSLDLPKKVEVGKKELSMAESLIEGMTDEWQPEKYQDEYNAALMEVIQEKIAAGGKNLPARKERAGRPTNMIDLVEVLQQSLSQAKARKPADKKPSAQKKKRVA